MWFFLWTDALVASATKHGVTREGAEYVVRHAKPPFPVPQGGDEYRVWGQTGAGRYVEVVFARRPLEEIAWELLSWFMLAYVWDDEAEFVAIFHAMPMTPSMIHKFQAL